MKYEYFPIFIIFNFFLLWKTTKFLFSFFFLMLQNFADSILVSMNGRGGVKVCWGGGRRARACVGRVQGVCGK